jgi:tetratricopeptide (TPR) repeat protein
MGLVLKGHKGTMGLAANINITAFSLLLKLPFLFYSTTIFNSRILKTSTDILISGIILCLIILKSRASFISLFLVIILLTIYYFLNRKNKVFLKFSIKSILIFCLFLSAEAFLTTSENSIDRIGSITDSSLEDESINQRLNYYKSALVQFKEKPFGEGLGNWKIKSIKLNKDIINDYIVPYHMHNDFLQNLAELGLIGFILYGLIFLTLLLKLLKSIFWYQTNSKLDHFLLLGLIVYLVDASLNFPMARPMIQVYMILFFILILRNINNTFFESKLASKIFISILAIGIFLTLYVNYQSYITYKKQIPLMADFNYGKYTIKVEEYENIDFKWPNLSVTTIPLNSMIARYYENSGQYEKAINTLHQTKNINPYLGWNDAVLAASYFDTNKIDSAIYYSEKAYYKIPNNNLHLRLMLGAAKEKRR